MLPATPTGDKATDRATARNLLDTARRQRENERLDYNKAIADARELGLPWHDIAHELGIASQTARTYHQMHTRTRTHAMEADK